MIGSDGKQIGVLPTREAISKAREEGLDLILIVPNARPPVARITDLGKLKYEEAKHEKALRKSQKAGVLKEVKLSFKIGDHDLNVRVKHAREFLEKGHKVKASVYFRGREMAHKDIGRAVLNKLLDQTDDLGAMEKPPKMEGRNLAVILSPKAKNAESKNEKSSSKKI